MTEQPDEELQQREAPQPEDTSRRRREEQISIEFRIEDLVRNLIPAAASHCGGCDGCSGCAH